MLVIYVLMWSACNIKKMIKACARFFCFSMRAVGWGGGDRIDSLPNTRPSRKNTLYRLLLLMWSQNTVSERRRRGPNHVLILLSSKYIYDMFTRPDRTHVVFERGLRGDRNRTYPYIKSAKQEGIWYHFITSL